MRSLALAMFLSAAAAFAQPPVIRQAPDLTVVEPSGKQTTLASCKGKVTVLDFIFTNCIHCQDETRVLEGLYKDLAPKGLQVLSVAVNDNAAMLVPGFVQQFAVPWPVGYAPKEALLKFQGFSEMDLWVVPQIIVIDRKGAVRAQSPVKGDPNLQSATYLRGLLTTLLAEKGGATISHTKTPVKTTASVH